MNEDKPDKDPTPSLMDTVKSVAAAFFGVQSSANRVRDFKYGKASHFIIIGLLMTVAFVLALVAIVKLVLKFAGI